jgi:hypothetical protein
MPRHMSRRLCIHLDLPPSFVIIQSLSNVNRAGSLTLSNNAARGAGKSAYPDCVLTPILVAMPMPNDAKKVVAKKFRRSLGRRFCRSSPNMRYSAPFIWSRPQEKLCDPKSASAT